MDVGAALNAKGTHTNKRSRSSPLSDVQQAEKVSKMDADALKELMSNLLDEKIKVLASKKDVESIKDEISENTSQLQSLRRENVELKEEVQKMKTLREHDQRRLAWLEEQIKKKNIIVRGLQADLEPHAAIKTLCNDVLKIPDPLPLVSVRKLGDREGKMSVLVETINAAVAEDILKRSTMLKGTKISLEKDLNSIKLQQKKVMFELKEQLTAYDKSVKVSVRNEKLKIGNKWFKWNKKKELECKGVKADVVLKELYNENVIENINLIYNELVDLVGLA